MSKIWFFGDSYAEPPDTKKTSAKSWTINVAEAFPEYDIENHAKGGSSLDYLYYTYNKQRNQFQLGDIVIFTITTATRLFLSGDTDRPYFMNINYRGTPEGQKNHVRGDKYYDYFVSEFFNIDSITAMLDIFLDFLYYESTNKGLKIIGLPITTLRWQTKLPNRPNSLPAIDYEAKNKGKLQIAGGEKGLAYASRLPFRSREEWQKVDITLANHLTPRNNEILANKVIRNIKTNEPIDLGTEWEKTL
jgi:hypothetical protein